MVIFIQNIANDLGENGAKGHSPGCPSIMGIDTAFKLPILQVLIPYGHSCWVPSQYKDGISMYEDLHYKDKLKTQTQTQKWFIWHNSTGQ